MSFFVTQPVNISRKKMYSEDKKLSSRYRLEILLKIKSITNITTESKNAGVKRFSEWKE